MHLVKISNRGRKNIKMVTIFFSMYPEHDFLFIHMEVVDLSCQNDVMEEGDAETKVGTSLVLINFM